MTTTQARLRNHFEGDLSPYVATDAPANAAETVVGRTTRVHIVTPDGTNAVNLDAAARQGHVVTIVHASGGASSPALSFDDGDFVASGPSNLGSAGDTARVINTNGETDGWVVA